MSNQEYITKLEEENARLKAALLPFATAATVPYDVSLPIQHNWHRSLNFSDCRFAADAVFGKGNHLWSMDDHERQKLFEAESKYKRDRYHGEYSDYP